MCSALRYEIQGDWSNLKGTDYHIAYGLWLLLQQQADRIAFFRGNDLWATPTAPPDPKKAEGIGIALHAATSTVDLWIQLKAQRKPWTLLGLLADNLIANFIGNALVSEQTGRKWQVRLVTQGEVPEAELLDFSQSPQQNRRAATRLERIVHEFTARWTHEMGRRLDEQRVRQLALTVISQLAVTRPIAIDTLKAEIDLELAYLYLDRPAVQSIRRLLIGALLSNAALGPSGAREYDAAWLDEVAGRPLQSNLPFELDPVEACNQQVQAILDELRVTWSTERFADRPRLRSALAHFMTGRETLFVLVGPSGTGKSWAMADWACHQLAGQVRLLIPGSDLDAEDERYISRLISGRLRPLIESGFTDEQILRKFRAAARREGQGPPLVVLDNLTPPPDFISYRRSLARLVLDCRRFGIKLVFTCPIHVWQFYHLWHDITPEEIYLPEPQAPTPQVPSPTKPDSSEVPVALQPPQRNRSQSFVLGDLTPEEQKEVLQRRLPAQRLTRASHLLRAPAFIPLRRPYVLNLYLEQRAMLVNEPFEEPTAIDVDSLVDTRVDHLLDQAADRLTFDSTDVHHAFEALRDMIWKARPNGLSMAQAEVVIEPYLGSRNATAIDELRQIGLLTVGTRLRFAEPLIEERVFARWLHGRLKAGEDVVAELDPRTDAGVATALLRSLAEDDPVRFAERLIARDERWIGPVAEGLAQCLSGDYRVLAYLSVLSRPDRYRIRFEPCAALGQLAARGYRTARSAAYEWRAFGWVLQMFVSGRMMERFQAGRALSSTIEYSPERVERAMRLRFFRIAQPNSYWRADSDKVDDWVRRTLDPLLNVNHLAAAQVAQRLTQRYSDPSILDERARQRLAEDVDEARGRVALFDETEMVTLLADLSSPEAVRRRRAACALRTTAFQEPDRVFDPICTAIEAEVDTGVLNRLLWMTFPLSERGPDQLLAAFKHSLANQWNPDQFVAGQALSFLSNLAPLRTSAVVALLPRRLDMYPPSERAWLHEGLALAWWSCAETCPEARETLQALAEPDFTDVPAEFRIFTLRGAALAQLAVCSDSSWAAELRGQQGAYPLTDARFFFTDARDFIQRHATELVYHPGFPRLQELFISCLHEHEQTHGNPWNEPLRQARGLCSNLCFDMLVSVAEVMHDPLPLLETLPDGYYRFEAVHRLLSSGRTDAELVSFVRALCERPIFGQSIQAIGVRELCVKDLASLGDDGPDARSELDIQSRNVVFWSEERGQAVAGTIDARPGTQLEVLDRLIQEEHDLASLYWWPEHARSWQSILIARVYARMFDARLIDCLEARELCTQMLTAVRGLPASPIQEEYELIYGFLLARLTDRSDEVPLRTQDSPLSPIRRSHMAALNIVREEPQLLDSSDSIDDAKEGLLDLLRALRDAGWWEAHDFKVNPDGISFGTVDTVYVFPAVRLALVAVGKHRGLRDTAAELMVQRSQVRDLVAKYRWAGDIHINVSEEMLGHALEALKRAGRIAAKDERIWILLANLYLRLARLDDAEHAVRRGLAISPDSASRSDALYDLACVYARSGRDDECQSTLSEVAHLRNGNNAWLDWLAADPDFAMVRDKDWFQSMITKK